MVRHRATVKDVAKLANVSIATVSHVLNHTRYVSPEVCKRVEDALRETNYMYNNAARSLRSNKTNTIGVIIPDITNPFFSKIVKSLEQVINRKNYSMILCHSGDSHVKELELMETLRAGRVDGAVIAPASPTFDYSEVELYRQCPVVFIDRRPQMEQYSGVFINVHDIVQYAVEQLILAGHTKIGCMLGHIRFSTTFDRKRGYEDALQKHGIALRNDLVLSSPTTVEAGYERMSYYLQGTNCTAVFVANSRLSLGAIQCRNEFNIDVPGRMAIIGLAAQEWAAVTRPALTTVYEPLEEIGVATAELLLSRIGGDERQNEQIVLDACLSARSSY